MPDENPPALFRTPDNIEWQFIHTFSDRDKMQKFRRENCCRFITGDKTGLRIRFPCQLKYSDNCQFMLLALRTTKEGYHVYKHGQHQHNNQPLVQQMSK
jgi:hypothetical protein